MKLGKRILAGLTLLLAAVVLLLSLAGGIGVWVVKEPATTHATGAFKRIDGALDTAEQGLGQVKTSLARAAERLASVKEEQRKLALEARKGTALGRVLGRTVRQTIAPEIDNAHEKLHTVAEAAVVVNTVLEDVGNFTFLSAVGLNTDRLTEMNNRLADVGPAAWELSRLLGDPEPDADAGAQLSRIEQTVITLQGLVADYESQVMQVRQRAGDVKARALSWVTPVAVLVSLISFWVALSQLCLLSRAWSWLK